MGAGKQKPGPLDLERGHPPVDKGTKSQSTHYAPRLTGLDLSLTVDESLIQDSLRDLFRLTISEALRRGARDSDLAEFSVSYIWSWQRSGQARAGERNDAAIAAEKLWIESVIAMEQHSFENIIADEMSRISPDGEAKENPVGSTENYRYKLRPFYYSHGYTDPADFLEEQIKYPLLGKPSLLTWIHSDFANRLNQLPDVLKKWGATLTNEITRELTSANGLQIRVVKGSQHLSNHAFGLAIDVNAYPNPHVVGAEAIAVFNSVALVRGVNFDFGKAGLSKEERGHANYTADDIMELYNRAKPASDAIRTWLQAHLRDYKTVIERVASGEKELGMRPVPSNKKLETRRLDAEAARSRLQRQRELQNPNRVSVMPVDTPPEDIAFKKVDDGLEQISSDFDLSQIQILYENYEPRYIDAWVEKGVMTMPLNFAIAMVAELGLRWGEQYEGSKDAMHFEMVQANGKPVIEPDYPLDRHEQPRTLQQLIDSSPFKLGRLKLGRPDFSYETYRSESKE